MKKTIISSVVLVCLFVCVKAQPYKGFFNMKKGIYYLVDCQFRRWCEKGEFEKTVDYTKRLQEQSTHAFDSICDTTTKWFIDRTYRNLGWELQPYDADNEVFKINGSYDWGGNSGLCEQEYHEYNYYHEVKDLCFSIAIPINEAPMFKEDNDHYNHISVSSKDWCFANQDIIPTQVDVNWKKRGKSYVGLKVVSEKYPTEDITVVFDNLGMDFPVLKGHIWKLYPTSTDTILHQKNNPNYVEGIQFDQKSAKQKRPAERQKSQKNNRYNDILKFVNAE